MIQSRTKIGQLRQAKHSIVLNVEGLSRIVIELTGTFTLTTIFEYTINGTDWYTLTANLVQSSSTATGATAAGKWEANVSAYFAVRVRCSAFTSGTVNVFMRAIETGAVGSSAGGGSGDASAANQEALNVLVGAVDEAAPASDTANSGLNGRLKRIAQNITAGILARVTYNATPITKTDGQTDTLQIGSRGALRVELFGASSANSVSVPASFNDSVSNSTGNLTVGAFLGLFNGTTWDRWRNNVAASVLTSAARTATTNSTDQTNHNGKGVALTLNVTANPGGGETLSLKLQGKDPVSSSYYDIVDGGVQFTAANGTKVLYVAPGVITADLASGVTAKTGFVPRTFRAVVTHSSTGSWTYSLASDLLN